MSMGERKQNGITEETGDTWLCHARSIPKQLRGCGRKRAPSLIAGGWLRLPSTRQVSQRPRTANRSRPRVPDPSVRPARPPGSPRARVSVPPGRLPRAHRQEGGRGGGRGRLRVLGPHGSASFGLDSIEGSVLLGPRRSSPGGISRAWMEVDERKQIRDSATHRHHERQEERVTFPAQGLMGQEAGSSFKLTRERREKVERR